MLDHEDAVRGDRQALLTDRLAAAEGLYRERRFGELRNLLEQVLADAAADCGAIVKFGRLALRADMTGLAEKLAAKLLAAEPRHAQAHCLLGDIFYRRNRFVEATKRYDNAIETEPGYARAYGRRGLAYLKQNKPYHAVASALKATTLAPDSVDAWTRLASIFDSNGHPDLSAGAYAKALAIRPDDPVLKGSLLAQRMLCCEWRGIEALVADVERALGKGIAAINPFYWQAISDSPRSLQLATILLEKGKRSVPRASPPITPRGTGDKIRIGYLSGEFHTQATATLMAGVYENHDRSRFEAIAVDNGRDDGSPMRRRLMAAFDKVVPIRERSTAEAVRDIGDCGIDILVNLNGYFGERRNDIFRHRAAPIQVNYLGFPGTVGDGYMDYIIADKVVLGAEDSEWFGEKIVSLPDSYQANDDRREMVDLRDERADHGLPPAGFVFACFNSHYKITPAFFAIIVGIVLSVDHSVLWLLRDSRVSSDNLRREAVALGLASDRIVFAQPAPHRDYLARHRHADLFLDTLPYGAHTTASDALWSGLPVLTCFGKTFPGRVGASLLTALDLPELVTFSLEDYARRAIALANDPEEMTRIRTKLHANRTTEPLFDTVRFTRHLEDAYSAMHERRRDGLAPDHIAIPARGAG